MENRSRTQSSTVSPKRPPCEMGASRKCTLTTSRTSARFSLGAPLDHQGGHCLAKGLCCDFHHNTGPCTSACINTGSELPLWLCECFGLEDLQGGHHNQGRGGLSSSTVKPYLTGAGRELRMTPPGCSSWRACTATAHSTQGNPHKPPDYPTIKGSER